MSYSPTFSLTEVGKTFSPSLSIGIPNNQDRRPLNKSGGDIASSRLLCCAGSLLHYTIPCYNYTAFSFAKVVAAFSSL